MTRRPRWKWLDHLSVYPHSGNPGLGGSKLVLQRLFREDSRIDYRSVFEVLEPCARKLACTVLRGAGGRKVLPA
jgi:hypothetical protein